MKTLFIAAGPISWASSRMRAYWPAAYMDDTEVVTADRLGDTDVSGYDNIIFQKVFEPSIAAQVRARGGRVYWDICDPAWWFQPEQVREILSLVDGVTASNENLRASFAHWSQNAVKTYTVPDRLELGVFPKQCKHGPSDPVRFIWFGISLNRIGLMAGMTFLERLSANGHNIALTIFDDAPQDAWSDDRFPVYHIGWSLGRENEVIASHDIAILPSYPGPWGKVKSNNKSLTAWACGLPVVDGNDYQEMEALVRDWEHRRAAGFAGYGRVSNEYTADKSAAEWEGILCAS